MGYMNSYRNAPAARFVPPTPKFRKLASGEYEVSLSGTVVGTVVKRASYSGETYWFGLHTGETNGLTANSRIDLAWALINS